MPYAEYLYHFTDQRNVESIRQHGLYSFAAIKARLDLSVGSDFYPSSDNRSREIDYDKNLSNFIRLCGEQHHPMIRIAKNENRIKEVAWLRMEFAEIVFRDHEVKFSNINAARADATVDSNYSTFTQSFDNQREVLVRFHIPLSKIEFL